MGRLTSVLLPHTVESRQPQEKEAHLPPSLPAHMAPCCPVPRGRNINLVVFPASAARPRSFFPPPPASTLKYTHSLSLLRAAFHSL